MATAILMLYYINTNRRGVVEIKASVLLVDHSYCNCLILYLLYQRRYFAVTVTDLNLLCSHSLSGDQDFFNTPTVTAIDYSVSEASLHGL